MNVDTVADDGARAALSDGGGLRHQADAALGDDQLVDLGAADAALPYFDALARASDTAL